MKKLYILFLILSFLSCSSDENQKQDCNPEMNIGYFVENYSIAVMGSYSLK